MGKEISRSRLYGHGPGRPLWKMRETRSGAMSDLHTWPPSKFVSPSELLHCKSDRSLLRDVARGARDGNGVCAWGRAGISATSTTPAASTAPAVSAPAATEGKSENEEKEHEHSEDAPPSPPPHRDGNEQDAGESRAARPGPEKPSAPIQSGAGCCAGYSKLSGLHRRTGDGCGGRNTAGRRIAGGCRSNRATQINRPSKSARGRETDRGCVSRSRSGGHADGCAGNGKTGRGQVDCICGAGDGA